MLLRPQLDDYKVIGYYIGKVIIGIGLLMLLPLAVSLGFSEWNVVLDFVIGIAACLIAGYAFVLLCYTEKDLKWTHGMVVASLSWLFIMCLGAIPYWLSRHFKYYIDACFDLMSGTTTTGLSLLQDLDHISMGLNTWRHLLTYVGGQGMVVVALTFLVRGSAGAYKMYVGEGKEERLLPNVIETSRTIWAISLIYLVLGSTALWITGLFQGLSVITALFHGLWLFMGAWSTGGFAPQSQNLLYYHSLTIELITLSVFILGSLNFALHYAIWTGNRREIYKNIEIISFTLTVSITFILTAVGLMRLGVYPDLMALFRKGFYQIASAHTTTGNMTVYARQFVREWGPLAMFGTSIAMAIGASACSTGGGFKNLRMGIITKAMFHDIRRLISPESQMIVQRFHHIKDVVLEDRHVRAAMLVVLTYILVYVLGTAAGMLYGYPFSEALFDAVSAGSNTGLTCGVTSPEMPLGLKLVYIFEMWSGRLEFMSVFALLGFIASIFRGK